jgi:hypothetical protein
VKTFSLLSLHSVGLALGCCAIHAVELPVPDCYGVVAIAPDAAQSLAAAQAGPYLTGQRNGLPAVWQNGLFFSLTRALPAQDWHPSAVTVAGGVPWIGGWREVPSSQPGQPPSLPLASAWFGTDGIEVNIAPAGVNGTPLIGSAVLGAYAGDAGDGTQVSQFVGYVLDVNLMERAAVWDFSNGPQNPPAVSFLPNGSRALSIYQSNAVGYQVGFVDQPQLWQSGQNVSLPLPGSAASYTGGRAVAVGSHFIVGYSYTSDGQTAHATIWNTNGSQPRDLQPPGFLSTQLTATAGNYLVGIGTDTNGTPHALLWTGDDLNHPLDLAPLLANDPIAQTGVPNLIPTAVDESGNITVAIGQSPSQVAYHLVRQGPSVSGLTVLRAKPTFLTLSAQILSPCKPVTAHVELYQRGVWVASSASQLVPAGTQIVTLTNTISGLTPASYYFAQVKLDGAVGGFGPTTVLYTPSDNLPPYGHTNFTFQSQTPLVLAIADLLAAAIDPQDDPVQLGDLQFLTPTAGGQLMYNFGDTVVTYQPNPGTEQDHFEIPLMDSNGRNGILLVDLALYVPPPVVTIARADATGVLTLGVTAQPSRPYWLQATENVGASATWENIDVVTTDALGNAVLTVPPSPSLHRFFRLFPH